MGCNRLQGKHHRHPPYRNDMHTGREKAHHQQRPHKKRVQFAVVATGSSVPRKATYAEETAAGKSQAVPKILSHGLSGLHLCGRVGTYQTQLHTGAFPKLLEQNNMRVIRFHDLRHSCASLLLSAGVSMKAIQEWLGHSTFSTTADIYAHLAYKSKVQSADAMETMLHI